MKLSYPAIFTFEDNCYVADFPDLPGCTTGGETKVDALLMAQDAGCGWILTALQDGDDIPKATDINKVEKPRNGFVSLIPLDIDAYAELYGEKAVRKTLTIPGWLNKAGLKAGINFSEALKLGLETKLNL